MLLVDVFNLPDISRCEAIGLGSITLAFIGDAVYSLHIKTNISLGKTLKSGALNRETSEKVCALAQAELVDRLLPYLTEDESDIYRRARNAKKPSKSKNFSVAQYNKSTGLEALIGFLYLTGNKARLDFVLSFGEKCED